MDIDLVTFAGNGEYPISSEEPCPMENSSMEDTPEKMNEGGSLKMCPEDKEVKAKQQVVVKPGICPPEGCPPPTRIECIQVDKVYV